MRIHGTRACATTRAIARVGEAAGHVVDDRRPGLQRRPRRPRRAWCRCSPGRRRRRGRDHRQHPAQLLGGVDPAGARAGWTRRRRRRGPRPPRAARSRGRPPWSRSRKRPPSEKESGVTFRTPITTHRPGRGRSTPVSAGCAGGFIRCRISAIASARDEAEVWNSPRTAEVVVPRAGLADPAHRHAQVLGLDHDDHALRVQLADQRVGDLRGQPLLHLRAPGVEVDQPGELGQPGDPAVAARDVADVRDPVERQQVVLAQARDRDVADQDQLVVVLVEGLVEHRVGSAYSPARISPYARATRAGVSRRPSRSGSSPTAMSSSRIAASARAWSSSGTARPSARATAWAPRGTWPSPSLDPGVLSSGPRRRTGGAGPGRGRVRGLPRVRRRVRCPATAAPGSGRRRPARRRPRLPGRRGRGPPVGRRAVVGQHRVRRLRAGTAVGRPPGCPDRGWSARCAPAWGAPPCGAPACGPG